MVTYRRALKSDAEKIKECCQKNNILNPAYDDTTYVVFIAEDDDGKILGVSAVKIWHMVEPLIARNPLVANVLLEKAIAAIQSSECRVIIDSDRDSIVSQAEAKGFVITDKFMTILKRGT